MPNRKKLQELEGQLNPSQLVNQWLREAQQFDSPAEYFRWLLADRHNHSLEYRLIKQANTQRKSAPSRGPSKEAEEDVARWLRRGRFFETLLWLTNCEADKIQRECRNRLGFAQEGLAILEFFSNTDAWSCCYTPSTSSAADENLTSVGADQQGEALPSGGAFFVGKIVRIVNEVLLDLRVAESLPATIKARLRRRIILFKSIAHAINETRRDAATCARKLAQFEPANPLCAQPLAGAQVACDAVVSSLVHIAKAAAFLRFEQTDRAAELLKPYL